MRRISDEESHDKGFDLSEYWRTIWRKRFFILIPVILAGCITVVGVQFLKPVYKSWALIRMEDQNYFSKEVTQFFSLEQRSLEERRQVVDEETLAKIQAEIHTTAFVDGVVARLGLDENPKAIEEAKLLGETVYPGVPLDQLLRRRLREILTSKIKVSLKGPGIFEIACHDYNPETCYRLADAITTLFIDAQRTKQLKGLEAAGEFSEEQLEIYKKRLEDSEAELQRVQDRITELALQSNPVGESSKRYQEEFGGESNLRYAETMKERLDIRVSELEDVVTRIRAQLTDLMGRPPVSPLIDNDATLSKAKNSLTSHHQTQTRLELGARGVTSQDQQENQARIHEAESTIERRLTRLVEEAFPDANPDYRPLIVEYYLDGAVLQSLRSKLERLESYISSFKRNLDLAPRLDAELVKLQDQVKTDRDLYNSFLRAKTSAQIGQALQNTNIGLTVEVLEPASRPLDPVKPKKMQILILALVIGASIGIGGLWISEYTDTSFRNIDQIEKKLGLRVLGTVPIINKGVSWRKAQTRRQSMIWMVTSAVVIVLSLMGFYLYGRMSDKLTVTSAQQASRSGVTEIHAE